LLAQADARTSRVVATTTTTTTRVVPGAVRTDTGELMPRSRAELMAMQEQLPGMESRVDARGLVVRFGDYLFEPNRATLTSKAEQSLDALARVLRTDNDASVTIEGYGSAGEGGMALQRAQAVRDYLDARGVDLARIDARSVAPYAGRRVAMQNADPHVDIVIRTELD
jgi:outer membrane protein OmpA-like peptidoglycan-associated protein